MKNSLFDLVHSMSRNEKGYFKKYSLKHSTDSNNNYIKLFNAIEKQKEKNDVALEKKFKHEKFGEQLHVTKNYLYKQLLKSLESFHYSAFETKRLLIQAKLLSDKYLFAQSWEVANKAMEIALLQEDFTSQLEILDIKLNIMLQSSFSKINTEHLEVIYRQKQIILEKLSNLNDFQLLRYQISILSVKVDKDRKETQERIMKHPLLSNVENAKTFTGKIIYYQLNAYCAHFIKKDLHKSSEYLEAQQALFENDPEKKELFRKFYLNCLSSLLLLFKDLKDEKRFFNTLKTFKNYGLIDGKQDASIFSKSLTIETDFNILTANSEGIDQTFQEIKNGLNQMGDKITPIKKKILLYNCAYLFFMNNNLRQALRLINNILTDSDWSVRRDITAHTLWLQLQVFYEQDSFSLLKKQSNIIEKYLTEKRALSKNESVILDFFKRDIFPIENKRMEKKYFLELKDSLVIEEHSTFQSDGIDLMSWIDSKILHKTFKEIYAKKNAALIMLHLTSI